jgi:sortase A
MQDVHVTTAPAAPVKRSRNRLRTTARVVGVLFLLGAVGIGGSIAWTLWGTGFTTQRWQDRLRPDLERRIHAAAEHPAAQITGEPKVPREGVAIIKIPRIHLDMVVVEGTGTEELKKGPGHYVGTALPWQPHGRVAIAGHRTTYLHPFYSLDALRKGDPIVLETEHGTFTYEVAGTYLTAPDGILPDGSSALDQTRAPTLALTTCHPRYSAAQRLIVLADRVGVG